MDSKAFFGLWDAQGCDAVAKRVIRKYQQSPIYDEADVSAIMMAAHDKRHLFDPSRIATSKATTFQSFVYFQALDYMKRKLRAARIPMREQGNGWRGASNWREASLSEWEETLNIEDLPAQTLVCEVEIELQEASPFEHMKATYLSLVADWSASPRKVEQRYAMLARTIEQFHAKLNYLPSDVQLSELTGVNYETCCKDTRFIFRAIREAQRIGQSA